MFRLFDSLLGMLVLIIILKFALPKEVGDLVTEILVKLLSLAKNLLDQKTI